jgi:hypothetical protein
LSGIRASRYLGKFNEIYEQCSGGGTIEWETTTTKLNTTETYGYDTTIF